MSVGEFAVALHVGVGRDVDPVDGDHVFLPLLEVGQVDLAVAVGGDQLGHRGGVAPQVVLVHQNLWARSQV